MVSDFHAVRGFQTPPDLGLDAPCGATVQASRAAQWLASSERGVTGIGMGTMGMTHDDFMAMALELADRAAVVGEIPVGAVVVDRSGTVLAAEHNRREIDQDPTAHAEVLALRRAAAAVGSWRLSDLTLYVTLEPCPMCAGAIVNARLSELVYGCADPKAGAVSTLYRVCSDPRLNHRVKITPGVLSEACAERLTGFFRALRASKSP